MKNNPFKKIETQIAVPLNIKQKVMEELQALQLVTEFANLFTFKLGGIFKETSSSKK